MRLLDVREDFCLRRTLSWAFWHSNFASESLLFDPFVRTTRRNSTNPLIPLTIWGLLFSSSGDALLGAAVLLQLNLCSPTAAVSDLVDSLGEDPSPSPTALLLSELVDRFSAAVCFSLPEKSENTAAVLLLLLVVPDSISESICSKTTFTSASFIWTLSSRKTSANLQFQIILKQIRKNVKIGLIMHELHLSLCKPTNIFLIKQKPACRDVHMTRTVTKNTFPEKWIPLSID